MLGEVNCDQHDCVNLFKKKLFFDINEWTEFLITQMRTFLPNFFF